MSSFNYDVIVVGGGPSGSVCAAFSGRNGKKVLLVDRALFPRDKPCGDATSGKSIAVLKELGLIESLKLLPHQKMEGVIFSSPNGRILEITAPPAAISPGFLCRREIFDNVLFQNAKKYADVKEDFFADDLLMENGRVVGITGTDRKTGQRLSFTAPIVIGADGAGSIVAKKTNSANTEENHQVTALRLYYDGVTNMKSKIELHFVDSILPGYFWIFPVENGKANVGIGMITKDMKQRKINLQKAMFEIIENHPLFKERFKHAEKISNVKSWLLPLGSHRSKLHGNGYLLIGDAASLIDPFTGEGIGNGMVSGRIAADIIEEAFRARDFSERFLSRYQHCLFNIIGAQLDLSYKFQQFGRFKFLLNLIIEKASKNKELQNHISAALIDTKLKNSFLSPFFYIKILLS